MDTPPPPSGVQESDPNKGDFVQEKPELPTRGDSGTDGAPQTEGFLAALLPPGDSPQLRDPIPGQSKLGFPLPASYSLHKHSRPRLCTIGTLLVVGMQLTRKSAQTEGGGGGTEG